MAISTNLRTLAEAWRPPLAQLSRVGMWTRGRECIATRAGVTPNAPTSGSDLGHGALADGAGVAIVVEAARLISRLERKPARTIRVVLFANEEFGLSGAREYAKQQGDFGRLPTAGE